MTPLKPSSPHRRSVSNAAIESTTGAARQATPPPSPDRAQAETIPRLIAALEKLYANGGPSAQHAPLINALAAAVGLPVGDKEEEYVSTEDAVKRVREVCARVEAGEFGQGYGWWIVEGIWAAKFEAGGKEVEGGVEGEEKRPAA